MHSARKEEALPATEFDIMALISECALKGAEPAVLKELRELRREMSEEIDKRSFVSAMSRVQAAISQIATDASNPQTSSRYATLAALDRAIRPHYTAEGFSVQFDDEVRDGGLWVECTVSRGGWNTKHHHTVAITTHGIKGTQMMTATHAGASALSYGRRYTYGMAFNIAVERDDDGNAASRTVVSPAQLDELLRLREEHGWDTIVFCERASERLGYKIENLSMVLRPDVGKVTSWLRSKKKEPA
jgi:ERF superfamily